jgi:hypothetical protein
MNPISTTPLASLALRHGLAVFAGFLIHHGIALEDQSSAALITGTLTLILSTFGSWLGKLRWEWSANVGRLVNDKGREALQKALGSIISQLLAAFSGYLATTDAGTFNVQDPEALTLFFANAAASRWKLHALATGLPRAALVLALCLPLASCLSPASRDTFKREIETALVDAGKAFTAASLKATLKTLNAEREALEAAPIPPTWQEQVVQQNKLAAIKAAIALAQDRLAKLTSAKAVHEVNPVNKVKTSPSPLLPVSSSQSLPLSARRSASRPPPHAGKPLAILVMRRPAVPLYAAPVVASLRQ